MGLWAQFFGGLRWLLQLLLTRSHKRLNKATDATQAVLYFLGSKFDSSLVKKRAAKRTEDEFGIFDQSNSQLTIL